MKTSTENARHFKNPKEYAKQLIEEKDFEQARIVLIRLKTLKDDADAMLRLADCCFELGQCEDAVKWFQKASEQANKNLCPCPVCDQKISIPSTASNEKIHCPRCKYEFMIQPAPVPTVQEILENPSQLNEVKKAAKSGNSDAQFLLGSLYSDGIIVDRDPGKGFGWCKKAAAAGNIFAKFYLARHYYEGDGVKKDTEKAEKIINKILPVLEFGASHDNPFLQYAYGYLAHHGIHSNENHKLALDCYSTAAKKNNLQAIYALGRYYSDESNEEFDSKKAFDWLQKASSLVEVDHNLLAPQQRLMLSKFCRGCGEKLDYAPNTRKKREASTSPIPIRQVTVRNNCGNPFVSGVMTTLSHNSLPFSGGWRRAVARLLDYHLEVFCLLIPFIGCKVHGIATLFGVPLLDKVITCASLGFTAFLLDGIVFSIFGNTLGKFLFGVKVINTARGTLISKEEYFNRNFLVFIQGFGLCIYPVSLIMTCIQSQRVCSKKRRPATYDAKPGYDVVLFKNSTVKSFFGIVLFIGVTYLFIFAMAMLTSLACLP